MINKFFKIHEAWFLKFLSVRNYILDESHPMSFLVFLNIQFQGVILPTSSIVIHPVYDHPVYGFVCSLFSVARLITIILLMYIIGEYELCPSKFCT